MSKYTVSITYKDSFLIEADSKEDIRQAVRNNWERFGCQFEKMEIREGSKKGFAKKAQFVVEQDGRLVEASLCIEKSG